MVTATVLTGWQSHKKTEILTTPVVTRFDINAVNNFVDVTTRAALDGRIKNPDDIGFILDMYYILDREPPIELGEYAFNYLNKTQHSNGFWAYREFHYAPDTARKLLTYRRANKTPRYTIVDDYYQSINTWSEAVEDVNTYDKGFFWGGLWGYVTLWQLKGENPPWIDEYVNYAKEDFDNWKLKNHERNHLVGTFSQICKEVPDKEDLIDIIVKEQNPEDGGWGMVFKGEKSSSIETSHSLIMLGALGYSRIDEITEKALHGIIKNTYKTDVRNGKKIAGWSYYPEEGRMNIRSTTIVLFMLASRGLIEGNSDPYYIKLCD